MSTDSALIALTARRDDGDGRVFDPRPSASGAGPIGRIGRWRALIARLQALWRAHHRHDERDDGLTASAENDALPLATPAPVPSPVARAERSRPTMPFRHPFAPCDRLHDMFDALIRDGGGDGCRCQLRLRLRHAPGDIAAVRVAWRALGGRVGMLGARMRGTFRTRHWRSPASAILGFEALPTTLDRLAQAEWERGLDPHRGIVVRLALATAAEDPGAVLTWDHRLLDARAAEMLLSELPMDPATARPVDEWRAADYRRDVRLPRAGRRLAGLVAGGVALVAAERRRPLLRPHGAGVGAAPLRVFDLILDEEASARCDARQRATTGPLHANAFFCACVAGALEAAYGVGGDIHIDGAIDQRTRSTPRRYANCHGTLVLCIPAGMATRDLAEAARAFVAAHHDWVATEGSLKLFAMLSCMRWTGARFARRQLGLGHPGVAASCWMANTGRSPLQGTWFGAGVAGIDHVVAIPGSPGLGVFFHRDGRGLVATVIAVGAVGGRLPPERFAALLRHQLIDRSLEIPS